MKSTDLSRTAKKMDDRNVRKKRPAQTESKYVSGKKQFQQQHVLALAVSCLFISGFSMMPIPVHAAEDYLSISGGGGGAGGHYNSSTPANKGGGRTNDPGGNGGDSVSPGGGGGGGSFIGVATVDPDAAAGSSSTGTTGAAGGTSFFRPGTGTGTNGQSGADSAGIVGGTGGMGGTAAYDSAGDLNVNTNLLYFAGSGGDGGDGRTAEGTGGTGGQGGHLSSAVGNNMNIGYVQFSSGSGGAGGGGGSSGDTGTGGKGGDGGQVNISIANDLNSQGAVGITAGTGSNGGDAFSGNGGKGGDGGVVNLNVAHDINASQMDFYGGTGGERGYGSNSGIGGEGGKGGDIHVTVGNNVTTTGQIGLSGGQGYGDTRDEPADPADTRGKSRSGDGGSIWFSARNVSTQDIFAVTGNGGGFGSNKDIGGDIANGTGGVGGSVTLNVTESVNADRFYLYSHLGGMAGDASGITLQNGRSGDGGKSGDVNAVIGQDVNAGTMFVLATVGGGKGGDANSTGVNVTGGNGGDGGLVNVTVNGNLNTSNFTGLMSAGGDGGNGGMLVIPPLGPDPVQTSGIGGNGGSTGDINLTVAKSLTLDNFNPMMSKAGKGGDGNLTSATAGIGGNGGNSGTFNITVGENLNGGTVNMLAGEGGDGGNSRGGNGGNSSTVNISVGQNMTADTLVMTGGNGGMGGASDGTSQIAVTSGENGGAGGHSILNVTRTLQLNALTASSGTNGANGTGSVHSGSGGSGGNVSLVADTAILNQGTISKNDGTLKVFFNNLDMTGNDTTLTLNKTTVYDSGADTGVQLGTLVFGGARNMTTTGDGAFAINGIRVMGKGATYTGTALDASGKNLYFHLPAGIAKDEVMLHSNSAVNTEGSNVDLAAAGPIGHLSNGEKVILIDKTTGTIADNGKKTSIFYQGATQYDLVVQSEPSSLATARALEDVSGQLVLIREGKNVYGQAYAEGQIAGLAAVMQSGDLVARFGDKLSIIEKPGPEVFFSMQGTSEKVKTGSHIKSNGFEAMGGVATHQKTTVGTIHAGVFLEGGWGSYDAHNSFPTVNVKGDGNTKYFGGGVIARHDFDNNFYVEGSLRGGKVKTDYSTNDMGTGASFDSSVWYYGAHGGIGYRIPVREKGNVDVYGKVLWTQINSDNVTTGAGEKVHFDSADSVRSRLGVRYIHQLDEKVKGFVGLAWDHEFRGSLASTLNGVAMGEPGMKGSTGLLELGVSWQARKAWTFDANLRGMAGKHEGVTGMVTAKYAF